MKKLFLFFLVSSMCLSLHANIYQAPIANLAGPTTDTIMSPCAKINACGRAVATWAQDGVAMARYYTGTTWLPAETLSAGGGMVREVCVCFDDSNRAVAAWLLEMGNDQKIQASIFNGTSWSAPEDISPTGMILEGNLGETLLTNFLGVACNNSGHAVVAWGFKDMSSNFRVQTATYNGTAWTIPDATTFISDEGKKTVNVAIAMAGNNAVVAWSNTTDKVAQARVSANSGVTWQSVQTITDGTNPVSINGTAVDINQSGRAVILFHIQKTLLTNFIQAAIFNGTSWTTPEDISASTALIAAPPGVSINDNGTALAAWVNSIPTIIAVYFDGVQWLAPQNLNPGGALATNTFTGVVLNNWNMGIGTWIGRAIRGNVGGIDCAAGAAFESGTWCQQQLLCGDQGVTVVRQAVAVDLNESNQSVIVWVQRENVDSGSFTLQSRFVSPTITAQKNQFVNRFPMQGDIFNHLQWPLPTKQTDQLVVQRNGQMIAILPGSSTTYDDHNRSPGNTDSYSIGFTN